MENGMTIGGVPYETTAYTDCRDCALWDKCHSAQYLCKAFDRLFASRHMFKQAETDG